MLQVKNTEIKMTSVNNKVQFTSLNKKRCYFLDGVVYLPFGHPLLPDSQELKKSYSKIHTVIEKKKKSLKLENQAVAKNERVRILRSIYWQPITCYKWNGNTKVNQKDSFDFMMTCDYI